MFGNLFVQTQDLFLDVLHVSQRDLDHETVVRRQSPFQCLLQPLHLRFQAPMSVWPSEIFDVLWHVLVVWQVGSVFLLSALAASAGHHLLNWGSITGVSERTGR